MLRLRIYENYFASPKELVRSGAIFGSVGIVSDGQMGGRRDRCFRIPRRDDALCESDATVRRNCYRDYQYSNSLEAEAEYRDNNTNRPL